MDIMCGDRFLQEKDNGVYILAKSNYQEVVLISLLNGDSWAQAVYCKYPYKPITQKVFKAVCGEHEFIKIHSRGD